MTVLFKTKDIPPPEEGIYRACGQLQDGAPYMWTSAPFKKYVKGVWSVYCDSAEEAQYCTLVGNEPAYWSHR